MSLILKSHSLFIDKKQFTLDLARNYQVAGIRQDNKGLWLDVLEELEDSTVKRSFFCLTLNSPQHEGHVKNSKVVGSIVTNSIKHYIFEKIQREA